jgi:hypothetical protein
MKIIKHFHTLVHKLSAKYIMRMYSNYISIYVTHLASCEVRKKEKKNPEICMPKKYDSSAGPRCRWILHE